MSNTGLVLEGGGLRGVYTAGVLDFFMEKNLYFPYVIGVSAGACNGASYISRQRERSKTINLKYSNDPRYLSYRNFFRERSVFGIDFVYNKIPNELEIFDYQTFFSAEEKFVIGITDCRQGKPVYIEKNEYQNRDEELLTIIRASCSLPFIAPQVKYKDLTLLDGGISDSIPIKKSIEDGNKRNVIILTRNVGYVKEPFTMKWLAQKIYAKYKPLVDSMLNRHVVYNETMQYIEKLEKEKLAFVIRPSEPIKVSRLEKDPNKLRELYDLGYSDAGNCYEEMMHWKRLEKQEKSII